MKTFLFYLSMMLLALSFQASPLFRGTRPDLILIFVIYYSLKHGQVRGAVFGAAAGFLFDLASGSIIGPHILTKALAGYIVPSIRQHLIQWNIIISTLIIMFFSIADIALNYICYETFAGISLADRPFMLSVKQVLLTVVSGVILYSLLNPERENKRYSYELKRF